MSARRVLVSGGGGFVGRHLVEYLRRSGLDVLSPTRDTVDFRRGEAVKSLIADTKPTTVFHLAARSSPSLSWQQPARVVSENVQMTLNLLEALRMEASKATIVLVGSSQIYGERKEGPATEESPLRPGNPYAASKAMSDMLGYQYWKGYDLRIVRMRPFNHAGPGQSAEYVVSAIAKQIVAAEAAGEERCVLRTGDPESRRDFSDVRDVVRAYDLVRELGWGVFNVCSGRATAISEIIEIASEVARVPVRHEVDRSLLRTAEPSVSYGSYERLRAATGWSPEISLDQTVHDTLEWWRHHNEI